MNGKGLSSASATAISIFMSAALGQQTVAGTVTKIDSWHDCNPTDAKSGTVGANIRRATEELKVQDGSLLDTFHAGDKVTFSAVGNGGVKTITKLKKQ